MSAPVRAHGGDSAYREEALRTVRRRVALLRDDDGLTPGRRERTPGRRDRVRPLLPRLGASRNPPVHLATPQCNVAPKRLGVFKLSSRFLEQCFARDAPVDVEPRKGRVAEGNVEDGDAGVREEVDYVGDEGGVGDVGDGEANGDDEREGDRLRVSGWRKCAAEGLDGCGGAGKGGARNRYRIGPRRVRQGGMEGEVADWIRRRKVNDRSLTTDEGWEGTHTRTLRESPQRPSPPDSWRKLLSCSARFPFRNAEGQANLAEDVRVLPPSIQGRWAKIEWRRRI